MDTAPAPLPIVRTPRRRRVALWVALVALIAVAQSLLVWLTLEYENNRAQEQCPRHPESSPGDHEISQKVSLRGCG